MYALDDTIVAIASPPGGAARGILRISGPNLLDCVQAVFRAKNGEKLRHPFHPLAIRGILRLEELNSAAPCDLFLWPEGHSYTRQMVGELHTIGSPPLLEATLESLCAAGARIAEPGEFTLRAFLAGRIDLTQAEAVLGVIDAADPRQLQTATAQLAGGLATPMNRLRDMLLELLAHLEAGFDFADEDIQFITLPELQTKLDQAVENVDRLAEQILSRSCVVSSVRVVLMGQPNTGKSSMFNALSRRQHALVSYLPGTTRDFLTAEMDCNGHKWQLIDTAGLQSSPVPSTHECAAPEHTAQHMAGEQISRADVRLLCLDLTRSLDDWERAELACSDDPHRIVVWTKADLLPKEVKPDELPQLSATTVLTSSVTGSGLDELRERLQGLVLSVETDSAAMIASTASRCRQSLCRAKESLHSAQELVHSRREEELVAAEIRTALDELGKIVGAVYADDVLERIFSRFCVGK